MNDRPRNVNCSHSTFEFCHPLVSVPLTQAVNFLLNCQFCIFALSAASDPVNQIARTFFVRYVNCEVTLNGGGFVLHVSATYFCPADLLLTW